MSVTKKFYVLQKKQSLFLKMFKCHYFLAGRRARFGGFWFCYGKIYPIPLLGAVILLQLTPPPSSVDCRFSIVPPPVVSLYSAYDY